MAIRYTVEALIHLRESPLCVKPTALPPAEDWMGQQETARNNQQNTGRTGADRTRNNDGHLLDQTNRRPGADRHAPRNNANPDDINLGPPRTTFPSATLSRGNKPFDNDKSLRDSDSRGDRFAFRNRNGDGDNRDRDNRGNFRRRAEADQDSDGWSTVKPRKSFGHEGAERFHGRFGGGDRDRDRRARDNHQDDNAERPPRRSNFGEFGRDRERDRERDRDDDGDGDRDRSRRNGLHNKSWARTNNDDNDAPPPRERFDRAKSWRERDRDDHDDKPRERNYDRNWDRRDQRQEVEPEWLNEPADENNEEHTGHDLQSFLKSMKAKDGVAKPEPMPALSVEPPAASPEESQQPEKTESKSAPAVAPGPDKFFANFAPTPSNDAGSPLEGPKDSAPPKPPTGSRFQSFFASHKNQNQRQSDTPPTPAVGIPPPEPNPLLTQPGASAPVAAVDPNPETNPIAERIAFNALIQKLQNQTMAANTPPAAGGFSAPPPQSLDMGPKSAITSPGPYPPFAQEHRDEHPGRGYALHGQEIHAPRPQHLAHMPPMRPEQQLQDLIGQRRQMPPTQSSGPTAQDRSRSNNTQFLMTLMQGGGRNMPEPPRAEQVLRMPQPSRPAQIPQTPDREVDYQRERSSSQHQGRPQGLPAFFDEAQLHHHEQDNRRPQPTQILQRQGGPPGLEQMHPNSWMQGGNQQIPPGPGRPMIPPPGLAGNMRNGPGPAMYQNFPPMGGVFPPDGMVGPPRNNMAPPPGFFGGPPPPGPPGFIPNPGAFQGGPEAVPYGFDGRGMPPGGPFRRN